jgi:hypothetical protein
LRIHKIYITFDFMKAKKSTKEDVVRKNIDLPRETVEGIGRLAELDGRKTKVYIQRVLINHEKENRRSNEQ